MQGRQGTTIAQGNESILFSAQNQGPGNLQLALGMNETGGFFPWFQSYRVGGSSGSYLVLQPAAGNVLIGTTTDISGTGGLKVAGTSTASSTTSGALQVGSNVGLSGNAGGASYFGGAVTATGNAATTNAVSLINDIGGGGTAQYHLQGGTTATPIWRILRGNGAAGYEANGFNLDSYAGAQIKLNTLGGSGGTFAVTGGAATFAGAVTAPSLTTASSSVVSGSAGNAAFGSVSGRVDISPVSGRVALYGATAVDRYLDIIRSDGATIGVQLLSNGTSTFLGGATFGGTVIAPAATTALAPMRIPHGTAPTSPVNGDMWTTTAGLFVRINGVTVGPLS
jgi:hypothetical protein